MEPTNRKSFLVGLAGGAGAAACVALLMGQAGTQPPDRTNPTSTTPPSTQPVTPPGTPRNMGMQQEYFVTGDGNQAFLWQREGSTLRFVSQAEGTRGRDPARDPMRDPGRTTDPLKPKDPPKDPPK